MKKPPNLIYGVEESPPVLLAVLNGLQHVAIISINLVYIVLVARAAGAPLQLVASLVAVALLVLSVGTVLQSLRLGPLGSGYMCPSTLTATYLAPSLLAAQSGGLPLVFGMTALAGALEAALAPLLHRLRAIFPTEISGLIIFMIGLSAGLAGLRTVLGEGAAPVSGAEWLVGGLTLATMVALNIWGRNAARMLCALVGLLVGYVAAAVTGLFDEKMLAAVSGAPLFGLPRFDHLAWSVDLALVVPFAIASLATAMKAAGTITMCQRLNDADWVRPDMDSIRRGVMADGVSTVISGIAGGLGTNTSTPSVGLSAATGVASRVVAFIVAAIFVVLAFFPKVIVLVAGMPRPVIVAALLFAMSFIILNGLQTMTSRLLDARRTLVLGLAIIAGVAVEVFPLLAQTAPRAAAPIVGSSLVLSTVIALLLNLLFRLGVRKTVGLSIESAAIDHQAIEDFLRRQGGVWGARPDVVDRAIFGVLQLVDAVAENCWQRGPMQISASFDEFNLDVRLSYHGDLLDSRSGARPTTRSETARMACGGWPGSCCIAMRTAYALRLEMERRSSTSTLIIDRGGDAVPADQRPQDDAGPRILVVDDNDDNRYTLTLYLELEGYRNVVTAHDGEEAIAHLRDGTFDLVLLDVMMPKVDGYQVLSWLKGEGRLHHLPVLMISALNELTSVVRCIEIGAVDYLTKPSIRSCYGPASGRAWRRSGCATRCARIWPGWNRSSMPPASCK